MSTVGRDTMTGTTGTLLSAHTPEIGGSWVIATGTTNTAQLTSAGRVRASAASLEADYLNQGTPATADYDIGADLWTGTSPGNYAGVFGRADASAGINASTGVAYLGQYDHAALAWSVQKAVHNVFTAVGSSFSATLTNSTLNTFQLQMRGTALTLTVAGVTRVSTTDSAVTAAGRAGVFVSDVSATDGSSYELDNFVADDFAVALQPHVWHNPLIPQ